MQKVTASLWILFLGLSKSDLLFFLYYLDISAFICGSLGEDLIFLKYRIRN